MIVEQCVYRCQPGKLPDLLKRFELKTLALFEKHGFKPAGFFTTLVGNSHQELTYFLIWESVTARDEGWTAFRVDPDWIAARADSERNGPLVSNITNQILAPTSFSPWS